MQLIIEKTLFKFYDLINRDRFTSWKHLKH
jgi:hypothetical protein